MEIRVGGSGGWREIPASALPVALADESALVWVDVCDLSEPDADLLRAAFGFHPVAIRECKIRVRMPKFHPYPDHVFLVTHAPQFGEHGHVHYVELDQFIGERFLVTVHGPNNPSVPTWAVTRDVDLIWERLSEGRFRPRTCVELSHAIVGSAVRGMEETMETVTESVWALEQRVSGGEMGEPEGFLDEMFRTRHGLLAIANITSTSLEVFARMNAVTTWLTPVDRTLISDNIDQLDRANRLAVAQRDYLQGVIDFYRTRTDTKMTIAAERLAVIAVVTLPITAVASILGMNLINNDNTTWELLVLSGLLMLAMSLVLLRWAKKQGWW
ncbi:MAG: CorA family divalent cation transporter [Candidatus Nanopelagicales bacterium]